MILVRGTGELRAELLRLRPRGEELGFVPTMGALHAGHLALVKRARRENARLGVSIFVNPLQFGEGEDFEVYPRTEEGDLALCREAGVDLVLLGRRKDLYPESFATYVEVTGDLTAGGEGALREGHFRGVTTVVAKLFLLFQPTRVYFGWKDMQQCCVLKRMVEDLHFPIELVPCEVVREEDGLALSSRNRLLGPEDRALAPGIHRALCRARDRFRGGERSSRALCEGVREELSEDFAVDYVEIRDPRDFRPVPDPVEGGRILVAARIGGVRLLDNLPLVDEDDVHGD